MFWLLPPLPQAVLIPQVNMFPVVPLQQRVLIGVGIGGTVGFAYTLPTLLLAGPALAAGIAGGGFGAFVQTMVTQATGNPIIGNVAGISAGSAAGASVGFLLGGPPVAFIGFIAGSLGAFVVGLLP